MDEQLIYKMIRNCLMQYHCEELPETAYAQLIQHVHTLHNEEDGTELYEIIEDAVYEYLTK